MGSSLSSNSFYYILCVWVTKQRISGEGRADLRSVELRVRVPLEKEVPVTPIVEVSESEGEEQEFSELTEVKRNRMLSFSILLG